MAAFNLQAQDQEHFVKIVKELSSRRYQGRGYARNGVRKAGKYITRQFRRAGADEVTIQPFCIDINTFPGKMEMKVDGKPLVPGRDFSMREYSPGVHAEGGLYYIDTLNYDSEKIFADLAKPENEGCFVVCEFWFTYKHSQDFKRLQTAGGSQNAGLIFTWEAPVKFYKAYGEKVVDKPIIWATPESVSNVEKVSFDIDNKFLEDYESSNVIAKVEGARHDSCYVFTAHYDHLGNLGRKVYYPGANDNASGTAAIITLAEYYSKNRPEYDMYFIAFSGEDANLRGSTYFIDNPSMPLSSIKYLFNLDMIGDDNPVQYCEVSEAGMDGFSRMKELNGKAGWFKELELGELAANSDHWPFAEKDVPCILFENENGSAFPYYHTSEDNMKTMKTDTYRPLMNLITNFIQLL